jgi:hypothetical protein
VAEREYVPFRDLLATTFVFTRGQRGTAITEKGYGFVTLPVARTLRQPSRVT